MPRSGVSCSNSSRQSTSDENGPGSRNCRTRSCRCGGGSCGHSRNPARQAELGFTAGKPAAGERAETSTANHRTLSTPSSSSLAGLGRVSTALACEFSVDRKEQRLIAGPDLESAGASPRVSGSNPSRLLAVVVSSLRSPMVRTTGASVTWRTAHRVRPWFTAETLGSRLLPLPYFLNEPANDPAGSVVIGLHSDSISRAGSSGWVTSSIK